MRILVTGAAGFLGSHLSERFLSEGHEVWGLDSFLTGRQSNVTGRLFAEPNFKGMLTKDITEVRSDRLPVVDVIYNLACPASPPAYQRDPIHTMMTCVAGTRNILEHAAACGAVFVQASTSEVYGDPSMSPQVEAYRGNVNSFGPRACYDEGKRAAEALCYDYNRVSGVQVKVARIFNTYGPRMDPDDGRVVSNFVVQALRKQKITVYGDGRQTRSFCYVQDLIDGLVRLGQTRPSFVGPVNLGNPKEFTVIDLAFKVVSMVRRIPEDSSSISHMIDLRPLPIDDPRQRRPDISLAQRELSWQPKVELDEGLRMTIEYFSSELKREV